MAEENSQKQDDKLKTAQKIDFSIKMRNAALDSATRRQVHEWKFCILVWTAIAGLIGVLLANKSSLDYQVITPKLLICLGVAIIGIVIWFQIFCWKANQPDKRRGEMYEVIIDDALKITEDDKKEVKNAVDKIKGIKGLWSPISQIAVTAILLFAFWVFYLALANPSVKEGCCNISNPVVTNPAEIEQKSAWNA